MQDYNDLYKDIQKITDDFIKQVDSVASKKEAEIMEI